MHRKRIKCADGFKMSVQASQFHYCTPRQNEGPYSAVEVGFPSEMEPLLMEYKDGGDQHPEQSVYAYVPIGTVQTIIEKHGGTNRKGNATMASLLPQPRVGKVKVAYNTCYGGFNLSKKAQKKLLKKFGVESFYDLARHDPRLIWVIEKVGITLASGDCADLYIVEIEGNSYRIHNYDGSETVQTPETIDWITVED